MAHAEIELTFTHQGTPTLKGVRFAHDDLKISPVISELGEDFRNSPGLKYLAYLFVRTKWASNANYEFVGEGNSADAKAAVRLYELLNGTKVAACDYMKKIFGISKYGDPMVSNLLIRAKPNGVRTVRIDSGVLTRQSIRINFVSQADKEKVVTSVGGRYALEFLSEAVLDPTGHSNKAAFEEELFKQNQRQEPDASKPIPQESAVYLTAAFWEHSFRKAFVNEVISTLGQTEIFGKESCDKEVVNIIENPSFSNVAPKGAAIICEVDAQLAKSFRMGVADASPRINKDRRITVATSPNMAASVAIFKCLNWFYDWNFDLNLRFPHTLEIVDRILAGSFSHPPSICVLGHAPSARLLKEGQGTGYHPIMLMPKVSQRIVAPIQLNSANQTINQGNYLFMKETPSGAQFYFEGLLRLNKLKVAKVKSQHKEPDEVVPLLADGDPDVRSILWFPHYLINAEFNNCKYVDDLEDPEILCASFAPSIMFGHEEIFGTSKAILELDVAVRNTWLELLENSQLFNNVIHRILSDEDYMRLIRRFSGIRSILPNETLENLK